MKQKNIGINAILNAIKSSLSIIFPLISYPYILRALGTVGLGKVSYVMSIVSYFSLIAMLGVSTYGVREGAKARENKEKLSEFVSQVFTINVISTVISYILLFILVCAFKQLHDYALLFVIISFSIISQTLAVDWVNTIFEDFAYITLRSVIVYIVQLILIFLLIRDENDYFVYAVLHVLSPIVICVTNWFYCRKYVRIKLVLSKSIQAHLKPLLILFANTVAISIYVNFDTTMLGVMKGDESVGLYAAATKVYSVVKSMMIAVYSVAIPRLSGFVGVGDFKAFKRLFTNLWCSVSLLLLPAGVGLFCMAEEVILIIGGPQFLAAASALRILSLALIAAIFGGLLTACLNVTIGRESTNLRATIISAGINFVFNLFCIPLFAQSGAALTTLLAELFVCIYCFLKTGDRQKYFDGKTILPNMIQVAIAISLMAVFIYIVKYYIDEYIICTVLSIVGAVIVYTLTLVFLKNRFVIDVLQKVLMRIRH